MGSVAGIGWVNKGSYGCVRVGLQVAVEPELGFLSLGKDGRIFDEPVKNFGRFDSISKLTCCACSLALKDAAIGSTLGMRENVGLLGTSEAACQVANVEYFKDYVDCGRTLARGNLFIYTLPSSSIAEAAIHLGLGGPTLYISCNENRLSFLAEQAVAMIKDSAADTVLIVDANQDSCVCLVLKVDDGTAWCSLDDAMAKVEELIVL